MLETAMTAASADPGEEAMLAFFCALARQCFVNEYIFFCGGRRGERRAKGSATP